MTTPEVLTVMEVSSQIEALPEDDQIKVRCITNTLRGILKIGGEHAQLAFALLGAKLAAGMEP